MIDKEISEEAKRALAEAAMRRAANRLRRDGADSHDALRRRVRAFAAERSLSPADIAKLMYKRISTRDVMAFCKKHKVSFDWLLYGDLRGLHRMAQEAKAAPQETPEALRKEVMALFPRFPRGGKKRHSSAYRDCWRETYEASSSIGKKAQPAKAGRSRETVEAVNAG
jgi:hypothetical protein